MITDYIVPSYNIFLEPARFLIETFSDSETIHRYTIYPEEDTPYFLREEGMIVELENSPEEVQNIAFLIIQVALAVIFVIPFTLLGIALDSVYQQLFNASPAVLFFLSISGMVILLVYWLLKKSNEWAGSA